MSEVIHRLDGIAGENLKIKTNIGNIEKEIELQSDKIVVVSDLLVKVQKQTNRQKTSFGKSRTATEMDGTLHTDFRKSETSRDIKKNF